MFGANLHRKPKHWIEKALEGVSEPEQPRDGDHDRRPEQPEPRINRGHRKWAPSVSKAGPGPRES